MTSNYKHLLLTFIDTIINEYYDITSLGWLLSWVGARHSAFFSHRRSKSMIYYGGAFGGQSRILPFRQIGAHIARIQFSASIFGIIKIDKINLSFGRFFISRSSLSGRYILIFKMFLYLEFFFFMQCGMRKWCLMNQKSWSWTVDGRNVSRGWIPIDPAVCYWKIYSRRKS